MVRSQTARAALCVSASSLLTHLKGLLELGGVDVLDSLLQKAFLVFPLLVLIVFVATVAYQIGHDAEKRQLLVVCDKALVPRIL